MRKGRSRKTHNLVNILSVLGMTAVFFFNMLAPVFAVENGEEIRIGSREDFIAFSEKCQLDSYSRGKTVILTADISLEGLDFAPIPTFGGTFEGNGHTIYGLSITGRYAPAGVFGELQEGATVQNLKVEGKVKPSGDADRAGGIAGINKGNILNCSFSGSVGGEESIGGIAGRNEATGMISTCQTRGEILGENLTGGIVGSNLGTIYGCQNDSLVNTNGEDPTVDLEDVDATLTLDFSKWSSLDTVNAATDTGGIAGYSSGALLSCENTGKIGYPHVGYNVGGIVGRGSGYVLQCKNSGEVYGRLDIGGIIGQAEPYIQVVISESTLNALREELLTLGTMTDAFLDEVNADTAKTESRVQSIHKYYMEVMDAVDDALKAYQGDGENGDLNETEEWEPDGIPDWDGELDLGLEQPGEDWSQKIAPALNGLSQQLNILNQELSETAQSRTQELKDINRQINVVYDLILEGLEKAGTYSETELYSDASEENVSQVTFGKIDSCTNSGSVNGDIDVGGIAGTMSLNKGLDEEDELSYEVPGERQQYQLKVILQSCINKGNITGKRNYVGGICGKMDYGLILNCEAYKRVKSEAGDYIGGIAGVTGGSIQNCYSRCTLGGRKYIGGIVGAGVNQDIEGRSSMVSRCYSLVQITDYEQYYGAIGGIYQGDYVENYFVSHQLAGIDRVSYAGNAQPISYEEMCLVEGLPQAFTVFTLSFIVEDEVIQSFTFKYGNSFEQDIFPDIPEKYGCYARWDREELTNLCFDTEVRAIYTPYITALESGERREDGRAVLLVEGEFDENYGLIAINTKNQGVQEEEADIHAMESWHLEITAHDTNNPGENMENQENETYTIRYLPPEGAKNLAIYVKKENKWEKVETGTIGSYLFFQMEEEVMDFMVCKEPDRRWVWIILIIVLVLVLYFFGRYVYNHFITYRKKL